MYIRSLVITFIALLACSSPVLAGSEASDDKAAIKAFTQSEVVDKFHKSAYGYAVFPTIGKGGIGLGGAHGTGRVYRGGKKAGDVSMTQLTHAKWIRCYRRICLWHFR